MTNLEKIKNMSDTLDFACAIASVAAVFKASTEHVNMSTGEWSVTFARELKRFLDAPYDGVFEKPDEDSPLVKMLKDMMRNNPSG